MPFQSSQIYLVELQSLWKLVSTSSRAIGSMAHENPIWPSQKEKKNENDSDRIRSAYSSATEQGDGLYRDRTGRLWFTWTVAPSCRDAGRPAQTSEERFGRRNNCSHEVQLHAGSPGYERNAVLFVYHPLHRGNLADCLPPGRGRGLPAVQ